MCVLCGMQYPPLAAIPAEVQAARFGKLLPTAEPSFLQWCRHYKVEASLGPGGHTAAAAAATAAAATSGREPAADASDELTAALMSTRI